MQNRLGIFAKHWTPGQVKTRLGTIGTANACRAYFRMLNYLIHELRNAADERAIVYAPLEQRNDFLGLAGGKWELVLQAEGDLGSRLQDFFEFQFKEYQSRFRGVEKTNIIVIGADCPEVDREIIDEAFSRLADTSVVLGPSHDGGYYLIGMNKPHGELFQGIDWGTDKVFKQTVERLNRLGIPFELLRPLTDVDTRDDLEKLISDWSKKSSLNSARQRLLNGLKQELP